MISDMVREAKVQAEFWYDLLDDVHDDATYELVMARYAYWQAEYERLKAIEEKVN